jgi:hypothetical protein
MGLFLLADGTHAAMDRHRNRFFFGRSRYNKEVAYGELENHMPTQKPGWVRGAEHKVYEHCADS